MKTIHRTINNGIYGHSIQRGVDCGPFFIFRRRPKSPYEVLHVASGFTISQLQRKTQKDALEIAEKVSTKFNWNGCHPNELAAINKMDNRQFARAVIAAAL